VYVLHEDDWNRAVDIMRALSGPAKERIAAAPGKAPLPVWLVIGVSALLVAALGGMLVG
jgi:hypothetical protein